MIEDFVRCGRETETARPSITRGATHFQQFAANSQLSLALRRFCPTLILNFFITSERGSGGSHTIMSNINFFKSSLAIAAIILPGCANLNFSPGTTNKGVITIDSPEVFTRERVVNDRRTQEAWLKKQLELCDQVGSFQGFSQSRETEGVNIRMDTEVLRSQQMAKKLQEGTGGQQGTDKGSTLFDSAKQAGSGSVLPNTTLIENRAQSSSIDSYNDKQACRGVIRDDLNSIALDDRHDLNGQTLYRLKFDSTVIPEHDTSALAVIRLKLSAPTKILNCTKPPRPKPTLQPPQQGMSAEENKKKHEKDLAEWSEWKAAVEEPCNKLVREKYNQWMVFAESFLNNLYTTKASLLSSEFLPEQDIERLLEKAETKIARSNDKKDDGKIQHASQDTKPSLFHRQAQTNRKSPGYLDYESIQQRPEPTDSYILLDKLVSQIEGLPTVTSTVEDGKSDSVLIKDNSLQGTPPKNISPKLLLEQIADSYGTDSSYGKYFRVLSGKSTIHVTESSPGFEEFKQDYFRLLKTGDIYSYDVTPRESVQRISDVGSYREISQFLGSLRALLGTTDLKSTLELFREREALSHAIRRQPLVVGFGTAGEDLSASNSKDKAIVGWIIGPKFGIAPDGTHHYFRHVPIQNSLSTTVSVPGWWENLSISADKCWLGETVNICKDNPFDGQSSQTYTIKLPGDIRALDSALLDHSRSRLPTVYFPSGSMNVYPLSQGKAGSIIIHGTDLWRSTAVTVGSWMADNIMVLPDMEGIQATFEPDKTEKWDVPGPLTLPVKIWTSEGWTLAGIALIRPANNQQDYLKGIAFTGKYYVLGTDLTFQVLPDALEQGFSELKIGLRRHKDQGLPDPFSFMSATVTRGGKFSSKFAAAQCMQCMDGDKLDLVVAIKPTPTAADILTPIKQTPIFYSTPDNAKVRLLDQAGTPVTNAPLALPSLPSEITLQFPAGHEYAYPEFIATKSILKASSTDPGAPPIAIAAPTCTSPSNQEKCTYKVSGSIPSGKKFTYSLELDGDKDKPVITGTLQIGS